MTITNSGFLRWWPLPTSSAWPLPTAVPAVPPLPLWNGQYQLMTIIHSHALPFPPSPPSLSFRLWLLPHCILQEASTSLSWCLHCCHGCWNNEGEQVHHPHLLPLILHLVWSEPCGHWSILVMVSMISRCPASRPLNVAFDPGSGLSR